MIIFFSMPTEKVMKVALGSPKVYSGDLEVQPLVFSVVDKTTLHPNLAVLLLFHLGTRYIQINFSYTN